MGKITVLFLKLLSILPFGFWLLVSRMLAPLLYYGIGYRKKVVHQNLHRSFPSKSEEEINKIAFEFYQHFCDVMVEYIKFLTISSKALKKRVQFGNTEVLQKYSTSKRDFIIVAGHYGNWEALCALPLINEIKGLEIRLKGIYKVQKNKAVDDLLFKSRSRHGLVLVPTADVKQSMQEKTSTSSAIVFLGDQSPSNALRAHWTTFLNQDTGILMGTERFAKIFDQPVVYMTITHPKRGHYKFDFSEITEQPKEHPKGGISELHHQLLEKDIIANPSKWLWTHKRWKKEKPKP